MQQIWGTDQISPWWMFRLSARVSVCISPLQLQAPIVLLREGCVHSCFWLQPLWKLQTRLKNGWWNLGTRNSLFDDSPCVFYSSFASNSYTGLTNNAARTVQGRNSCWQLFIIKFWLWWSRGQKKELVLMDAGMNTCWRKSGTTHAFMQSDKPLDQIVLGDYNILWFSMQQESKSASRPKHPWFVMPRSH